MAWYKSSPASSMIDESCFADVSTNGSLGAVSVASMLPLNAHSNDANVKIAIVNASKSPGTSLRSKSSGAHHVGEENVSPNQTFTHVAPNERKPPGVDASSSNFSNDSVCTTIQQTSSTYPGQRQDCNHGASVKQEQSHPRFSHLLTTSLYDEKGKLSKFETGEGSLNYDSDEESLVGPSLIGNCSSGSRSLTVISKPSSASQNLKRAVSSIRSVKLRKPQHLVPNEMRQDLGDEFEPTPEELRNLQVPKHQRPGGHRKTSSGLSSVLLGVFNSVAGDSTTSSTKSGHPKSQLSRSRWSKFSNRSSTHSDTPNHISWESDRGFVSASHKATIDRALQRRRILGELVSSETGYISDLKILAHVYLAMLGSTQMVDKDRLRKAQVCVTAMIAVHDDILAELKRITRDSSLFAEGRRTLPRLTKHVRFESNESSKSAMRKQKRSRLHDLGEKFVETRTAEPKEAAEVAKLFTKMLSGTTTPQMGKFSIYEEYGAMYAEVLEASASSSRAMPDWGIFERGIEALVHHVLQPGSTFRGDKKGLTLEDLLIKPLQRICRYPLLFADLQSHCPAVDDPEALVLITNTLERLRGIAHGVNNVTNDLEAQASLRRTQQLADMLKFPVEFRPSFSLTRDLGHAKLCGVLFVAYRNRNGSFEGGFMLCALFNSHLLLAAVERGYKSFTIEAIVRVDTIRLDTARNGTGLQCHDTPYAWKMLFQSADELHEMVLCACTDLEQQRWKSELESSITRAIRKSTGIDGPTSSKLDWLYLDLEPLVNTTRVETVHKPDHSINVFSVYESSTPPVPVSIRNTHVSSKGDPAENHSASFTSSDRSSMQVSEVLSTLVADKIHRARIEHAMSGIWTRDTLPFPAMTASRSGQLFRASTSIMRRLSKASITSSPSKRSASQRSHASTVEVCYDLGMEDPFVEPATARRTEMIEQAGMKAATQTLHHEPERKASRKISFSDAVHRPKVQIARDNSSETMTILGIKSCLDAETGPKKSDSLFKASKERLRSWLV